MFPQFWYESNCPQECKRINDPVDLLDLFNYFNTLGIDREIVLQATLCDHTHQESPIFRLTAVPSTSQNLGSFLLCHKILI